MYNRPRIIYIVDLFLHSRDAACNVLEYNWVCYSHMYKCSSEKFCSKILKPGLYVSSRASIVLIDVVCYKGIM